MISGGWLDDDGGGYISNSCVAIYTGGPTPEGALRELKQKTREELNQDGFYRTVTRGEDGERFWTISNLSSKKPLLRFAESASGTDKANATQFVRVDYYSSSEKSWHFFSLDCLRTNDPVTEKWLTFRLLFGGFFIFD